MDVKQINILEINIKDNKHLDNKLKIFLYTNIIYNYYIMISKTQREKLENQLYAPYEIGKDLRDYDQIYKYRTHIQRYDHNDETMQFLPNFIQTNRRNVRLPDTDLVNLESDLRGITRNLSKVPQARYLGPNGCSKKFNDKGLCVCPSCLKSNVVNQNTVESKKKIINNRIRPTFSDCSVRRTTSSNGDCKNNVYKKKQPGMLDMIKGLFF